MIDTLSTPFPPPRPVLGASLSQQGGAEVNPAATAKVAPAAAVTPAAVAPAASAAPAIAETGPSEGEMPKIAAFPQVLESFFYRYQLDMEVSFAASAGDSDTTLPGPQLPPPEAPSPPPTPIQRSDAPEPGSRRAVIASAFKEVRSFQVRSFTQQTTQLAGQLSPATGDKLRQTSRSVGRAFSMDFSLKVSFLHQFSRQSQTLAGHSETALSNYLDVSKTLSVRSAGDAQGFFDQVDQMLTQTEETLHGNVDAFLQEMKGQLALGEEDLAAAGQLLHQGIADFFSTAADFLDQAEAQFASYSGDQAPDLPPPEELQAALAA
ncbi:MAG: hypothetical protein IT369_20075 [Candidatus Latescibacteria bacterium]|nr:hypothetical protein [Candidatus Latescibacterota bacterium]